MSKRSLHICVKERHKVNISILGMLQSYEYLPTINESWVVACSKVRVALTLINIVAVRLSCIQPKIHCRIYIQPWWIWSQHSWMISSNLDYCNNKYNFSMTHSVCRLIGWLVGPSVIIFKKRPEVILSCSLSVYTTSNKHIIAV